MIDRVLLPATDRGVALQIVIVVVGMASAWWLLGSRRHWRPAAMGIGLLLLGAMGLRAAH